ncbi:hypothetical protein CR513_44608, partial [Mucuna pruriens]
RQSISVASVCIQPRPSRIVSVEIDSVQSLLRATRPLPRRVDFEEFKGFLALEVFLSSQLFGVPKSLIND